MLELHHRESGRQVAGNVRTAYTFLARLKGLLFTATLAEDHALHLKPCRSVHSFLMRYPIDVMYLDEGDIVVGVDEHLMPNRIGSSVPKAQSVVEMPAGSIRRNELQIGDKLQFKFKFKGEDQSC